MENLKKAWNRFEIARGVYKQDGIVLLSTLLSIIGEGGVKKFDTFTWGENESEDNIEHVLKKFDEHCEPRTQVIYERYRLNNRKQEEGENISSYLTELRTIARNCDHESITPDDVLRVQSARTITTNRWFEIVKAAEQIQQQVKLMSGQELLVNSIRQNKDDANLTTRNRQDGRGKEQKEERQK